MLKNDLLVRDTISVKDALKQLDKTAEKVLLVVDDAQRLIGALTDGDIRRYILKGGDLLNAINGVYKRNPIFIFKNDSILMKPGGF